MKNATHGTRPAKGNGKNFIDNIRLCGYDFFMKKTAQLFKALSDETRLRILSLLTQGELCVCDLMATLDLPQSTVSRHLAYLRNTGLVEDRRQGVWMYYCLADEGAPLNRELMELLAKRLEDLPQARQDRESLEAYLGRKAAGSCS